MHIYLNGRCYPHRQSLIAGLTLEAARWDAEAGCLADSLPGQLRQVGSGGCFFCRQLL